MLSLTMGFSIVNREAMPAAEAATRVGIAIFASVLGMSFGGWASGVIFDATGSYAAALANGLAWKALNIAIIVALLVRARARLAGGVAAVALKAAVRRPPRIFARHGRILP
jgi:hypothetical protein